MKDIYSLMPVNKTASIVTSQYGCENSFLLSKKEQLKTLGLRKKDMMDNIINLKKTLGIDGRAGNGANTKYPKYIVRNPLFKTYLHNKEEINEIERQILKLKKDLADNPEERGKDFNKIFVDKVKAEYPMIFSKIKSQICNSGN